MRELSSVDKQIIGRIIKASESYDLKELQVAKLLREELRVFALEWDASLNKISIYAPRIEDKPDFEYINKNYFDISYFLYLIEALEEEGYIKLQSILSDSKDIHQRNLYDRENYRKQGNNYIEISGKGILYYIAVDYSEFNLDIVKLLDKYADKIIFPLPNLKEYVDRGYITEDQKFRRDEIESLVNSVNYAKKAVWITAISAFFTAISTVKSCFDKNELNIKKSDIDRIEKIITTPNRIIIDGVDSLNSRTLYMKLVKNEKIKFKSKEK